MSIEILDQIKTASKFISISPSRLIAALKTYINELKLEPLPGSIDITPSDLINRISAVFAYLDAMKVDLYSGKNSLYFWIQNHHKDLLYCFNPYILEVNYIGLMLDTDIKLLHACVQGINTISKLQCSVRIGSESKIRHETTDTIQNCLQLELQTLKNSLHSLKEIYPSFPYFDRYHKSVAKILDTRVNLPDYITPSPWTSSELTKLTALVNNLVKINDSIINKLNNCCSQEANSTLQKREFIVSDNLIKNPNSTVQNLELTVQHLQSRLQEAMTTINKLKEERNFNNSTSTNLASVKQAKRKNLVDTDTINSSRSSKQPKVASQATPITGTSFFLNNPNTDNKESTENKSQLQENMTVLDRAL